MVGFFYAPEAIATIKLYLRRTLVLNIFIQQSATMVRSVVIRQKMDFLNFYYVTVRTLFRVKIVRTIILIVISLSVLSLLLQVISDVDKVNFKTILQSIISCVMVILIYAALALIGTILVRFAKPSLFKPVTYEFNNFGMTMKTESLSISKAWRDFIKLEESGKYFFLYLPKADVIAVVKRNFENEEQVMLFRHLWKQKDEMTDDLRSERTSE